MKRLATVLCWTGAAAAAAIALVHLALVYYVMFSRVGYPFDLEWMEGSTLCHALRLLQGKPLYAPPSADFISFLYTPLYPALLAGLSKLFGLSYALGRVVSIACFTVVLGLLGAVVWRETRGNKQRPLWVLTAVGLMALSFRYSAYWFDLVRSDSLYLALVVGGLYLLAYHHDAWAKLVTAGLLLGLAFLAKQTASLFIVYAGMALLLLRWRRLPVLVAVVGLVAGGTVLVWNHLSGGWLWAYVFEMHQGHDFYLERALFYTPGRLFQHYPVVFSLLIVILVVQLVTWIARRVRRASGDRSLYWWGVGLTGLAVAMVGFGTQWAFFNAFIPGLVLPAAVMCLAVARLVRRVAVRSELWAGVLSLVVGGALCVQMAWQLYDPRPQIPTAADRKAGQALVDRLQRYPGPVLLPYHPYYAHLAGKPISFQHMGVKDVTRAGYPYPADIRQRVRAKAYDAIVLDYPASYYYGFVRESYRMVRRLGTNESARTFTGAPIRPQYLLERR